MSSHYQLQPVKLDFNKPLPESPDGVTASPVTLLARNMGSLTTDCSGPTNQRHKLCPNDASAKRIITPPFCSPLANGSPTFQDSPMFQERVLKRPEKQRPRFSSRMRSLKLPDKENLPRMPLEPSISDDSQDSGYSGSCRSQLSSLLSSPKSSRSEDLSDGLLDLGHFDEDTQMPGAFDDLIQKPLLAAAGSPAEDSDFVSPQKDFFARKPSHDQICDSPVTASTPASALTPLNGGRRQVFKRPMPLNLDMSPISPQNKRPCQIPRCNTEPAMGSSRLPLKTLNQTPGSYSRCVMEAVQKSTGEPSLIGDFSKQFQLPLIIGKHQDLKTIAPQTVASLLRGEMGKVGQYTIVDCRYPYEYEAGHIRGAKNIFTREAVETAFLSSREQPQVKDQAHILVFHCEFSSERAPSLYRYLRNRDREMNRDRYPLLHHPELYLLEGGYKAFYQAFQELCDPKAYKPMLHHDHVPELKHFRAKSKSWSRPATSARTGLKF